MSAARFAEIKKFISDYIGFLRNLLIVITSDEEDAREIIDATIGGKLQVYPKVSYDSLF